MVNAPSSMQLFAHANILQSTLTNVNKSNLLISYILVYFFIHYLLTFSFRIDIITSDKIGVWDRWGTNGGKGLAMANWSDIDGTITLVINFNDTIDQVETTDASVNATCSGQTATLTFASTAENPLTIGVHLNHGTSIDNLKMTDFSYSVL